MKKGWHIIKTEGQVTVSRRLPARFDVSATTELAGGNPVRLATQIRQDMWRAVQGLRGFSPVVQVTDVDGKFQVEAGGELMGRVPSNLSAEIAAVLEDPAKRARWLKCAGYQRFKGSV